LFFNEKYFLIGFGIEQETSSLVDNKIEKNEGKKPREQTYDSIREWLLL
jgi:hypothetical protein